MADELCMHDLTASQCGTCKSPPAGVPRMVWITEGGDAFHRQVPPDARPCLVRVDDSWMEGWVLDAFKGDDQRWKGTVVYNDMGLGAQVTTIKDERDLKAMS